MIIDEDRYKLVVAPFTIDMEVAAQQSFIPETNAPQHRLTRFVFRADRRFEPVQSRRRKAMINTKRECSRRNSLPRPLAADPVTDPR